MKKMSMLMFAMLLSVALLLSACGGNSNGGGTNGEGAASPPAAGASGKPAGNEPATASSKPVAIKTFTAQGTNYNLDTNWFTQHVEEKFGIDFDFQVTTWDAGAAVEQRKIALASGDYPELFLMIPWVDKFSASEMIQYGKQGILLPLNDLIKQHAPHLQGVLDSDPNFRAVATSPDGNIYAVPQLIECYHCEHGAQDWINSQWLKKLGLGMPTTTEEFRTVLQAFKTKDPNGNGEADEIGLTGHTTASIVPYLMNAFIYDDNNSRMLVKDGKVDYAPIKPEWKEGVAYIASLYKEGLIDPSAFTQNMDAYNQLANNAKAVVVGVSPGLPSNLDYQKQYDAVPPLTGPEGKRFASLSSTTTVGGTFALTNKASEEVQIKAIELLDYLFTEEGQMLGYLGKEDVGWRKPQEGDVALNEDVDPLFFRIPADPNAPYPNTDWAAIAQYYQPKEFRDRWVSSTDIYSAGGYERRLQEATYLYDNLNPEEYFPYWAMWYDPAVVDEFAMLETNIKNYVQQNLLQFITGSQDVDKDWDAYVKGLEQLNLKRYLEIQQQAYDQYLAKQ